MRAYLHVGIAKTGTTSIQVAMDRLRDRLATRGICYPEFQAPYRWNHGPYVGSLFVEDPVDWPPNRRRGLSADDVAEQNATTRRMIEAVAAAKPATLVLSGEGFFYLKPAAISQLIAWLSSFTDDIRILAYFREPKSWATSHIQQMMKIGVPLDTLLARVPTPPIGRLRGWVAACGHERVRPFDYGAACRHGLVGHFLDQIGAADLAAEVADIRANRRVSAEALAEIARATAERGRPLDSTEVERIAAKHKNGSPFNLPDTVLAQVEAKARPDLDWLAESPFGLHLT